MRTTTEWKKLKGKIKNKFEKLSNSEIEGLNGHMDKLQSKVQSAYNYSEDKAKKECKVFNDSIKMKTI